MSTVPDSGARIRRPITRLATRLSVAAFAAGAAITALPGIASAHVTIQPGTAEGGGFSVVAFRVPNERDDASTTSVRVTFPEDQPIGSVRSTPVPGWKIATKTRTLEEPIEMFGEEVSEVVSQVTWTATDGGIAPGQFEDFDVSLGPLPEEGELVFQALQTYSSGEEVDWNQVAVDDSAEPEHPAPVLTVTAPADEATAAPAGEFSDSGGDLQAASSTASRTDGDEESSVLPTTMAAAALLLSVAALLVAWRKKPA